MLSLLFEIQLTCLMSRHSLENPTIDEGPVLNFISPVPACCCCRSQMCLLESLCKGTAEKQMLFSKLNFITLFCNKIFPSTLKTTVQELVQTPCSYLQFSLDYSFKAFCECPCFHTQKYHIRLCWPPTWRSFPMEKSNRILVVNRMDKKVHYNLLSLAINDKWGKKKVQNQVQYAKIYSLHTFWQWFY